MLRNKATDLIRKRKRRNRAGGGEEVEIRFLYHKVSEIK